MKEGLACFYSNNAIDMSLLNALCVLKDKKNEKRFKSFQDKRKRPNVILDICFTIQLIILFLLIFVMISQARRSVGRRRKPISCSIL